MPNRPLRFIDRLFPVRALALCAALLLAPIAAAEEEPGQGEQACDEYAPERRPFFGDTHVHTTHSQDASTQGTVATPEDAYRFARGEAIRIQPLDADDAPQRSVKLARPLDFAMVTDHAEQLGEVHICKTPGLPGHDSMVCRVYRRWPRVAFFLMNGRYSLLNAWGRWGFCGEDGAACLDAARTVWQSTIEAAESANDRSAECRFTSFVAYEWTAAPDGGHLHRNVIFRNASVPALPISVMETGPYGMALWQGLDAECRDGVPGCEALTIPHNSNLSKGTSFTSAERLGDPISEEEAPLRARYDRLVEMMQHKGEAECALVAGTTDEECSFEKVTQTNRLPLQSVPAPEAVDYVRDALKRGLAMSRAGGVNPLQFGLIGGTDTHLGTPGLTEERAFPGHGGAGLPARHALPKGLVDELQLNPGGLAVLWAEENRRDALFDAMQRREAYATSGTRPVLRFFGGWEYDTAMCDTEGLAEAGYAGGVPMGGVLPPRPRYGVSPRFVVSALRDPAEQSAPLEQVQIIKGWVDVRGQQREEVIGVVGERGDADVDLSTCERRGEGHAKLCSVWSDPDFDPANPAFYYARVLETPSCRWSQWACLDAGVDCQDPSTLTEGFEPCCAPEHQKTIRERAWSSPIWYEPVSG